MTTKKNKKPNVIPMGTKEFVRQVGADPTTEIPAITNDELKARLGALLSGEEEPANEFVGYLVEQLRAGNQEYRVVEQTIKELTVELNQAQKRAIQLQGEQAKYARDIMAWMDRDKPQGNKPKESKNG